MRLIILMTLLILTIFTTMTLTFYNIAYSSGYGHGVIAGFWGFDRPRDVKELTTVVCTKKGVANE